MEAAGIQGLGMAETMTRVDWLFLSFFILLALGSLAVAIMWALQGQLLALIMLGGTAAGSMHAFMLWDTVHNG